MERLQSPLLLSITLFSLHILLIPASLLIHTFLDEVIRGKIIRRLFSIQTFKSFSHFRARFSSSSDFVFLLSAILVTPANQPFGYRCKRDVGGGTTAF